MHDAGPILQANLRAHPSSSSLLSKQKRKLLGRLTLLTERAQIRSRESET